ncbi:MotA/TolQ/ExbB proton channel family protein [uncultured Salinisphaera sp.]|uniref:MotA/TolQ/ExbB proton channel family protein n=1 Tax=uncultured Salinisphaera sp. TaxID=359372 RepID=UPI0032B1BBEB|tara:strand:+ start:12181 stop:13572 length:1392 start_codon:yes stop_codon:yes gene_type:complete
MHKSFINRATPWCLAVLIGLGFITPAFAQDDSSSGGTLQDLLETVRSEKQQEAKRNEQRIQTFLNQVDQRQALLAQAQSDLQAAESRQGRLQEAYAANEKKIGELQQTLDQRAGDFGEVFGVVRQVAGDLRSRLNGSLTSLEAPNRGGLLDAMADSKGLPPLSEVRQLWTVMLDEMVASGEVSRFEHAFVTPDGETENGEIVRVGTFNATVGSRYLRYNGETEELSVLARQPNSPWPGYAANLADAPTDSHSTVSGVVDPSRGAILGLLIQKPNLWERIQQGGLVGYIVIAVGIIGLIIAIERLIRLVRTEASMRRQRKKLDEPSDTNPLGRVLKAYHDNRSTDVESLQLKLDQAILADVPGLERGLSTIRVLSAVAPLLGLLGTVVGMIATFQAITLFGTGDPKLMADGISQALVTTVLGLVVAVPLVLIHSMLSGRSRRLIQMLEQQSTGLVAAHAETHRA